MDRSFIQQIFVFAAIFLVLLLAFDLFQNVPITPGVFLSRMITTILATAFYGALTLWLKKRREPKE